MQNYDTFEAEDSLMQESTGFRDYRSNTIQANYVATETDPIPISNLINY